MRPIKLIDFFCNSASDKRHLGAGLTELSLQGQDVAS